MYPGKKNEIRRERRKKDKRNQDEKRRGKEELDQEYFREEEGRHKEHDREVTRITRGRRQVEILVKGMAKGRLASAFVESLSGMAGSILQAAEVMGSLPAHNSRVWDSRPKTDMGERIAKAVLEDIGKYRD